MAFLIIPIAFITTLIVLLYVAIPYLDHEVVWVQKVTNFDVFKDIHVHQQLRDNNDVFFEGHTTTQ